MATEIVALSIGPKACQETLRTALAMGADKGIHIETDMRIDQELQPLAVAKTLSAFAKKIDAGMVLLGKQAIDGDNCQTGQMTAGLLGWPQCTFASKLEVSADKKVHRLCFEVSSFIFQQFLLYEAHCHSSFRAPSHCVIFDCECDCVADRVRLWSVSRTKVQRRSSCRCPQCSLRICA